MQNRNKLVRKLLDGITDCELQKLVNIRESANQSPQSRQSQRIPPAPAPRKRPGVKQLVRFFENNPSILPRKRETKIVADTRSRKR